MRMYIKFGLIFVSISAARAKGRLPISKMTNHKTTQILTIYFVLYRRVHIVWFESNCHSLYHVGCHHLIIVVRSIAWNVVSALRGSGTTTNIARLMGPTWDPPGSCRPQMGLMLVPWTCYQGVIIGLRYHKRIPLTQNTTLQEFHIHEFLQITNKRNHGQIYNSAAR